MDKQKNIFLWRWTDRDIDNSSNLRDTVELIFKAGFESILVIPDLSIYKFTDKKVHRAISKSSNYSKKRNIKFYVMADPRHSSRFFISRTEERTQCLIVPAKMETGHNLKYYNTAEIKNGSFNIKIPFSDKVNCPEIQEKAVLFSFSGIEKVFLFKAENGVVEAGSVKDITHISYSFSNISKGIIEVTGEINCEENGFFALALPRFDTNLFDFAGRHSNDLVYDFANKIFDAFTNLDGMIWGSDDTSYGIIKDIIPVNLSIYNSFIAEYKYDIRDFLYALVLPVDDNTHIKIRTDFFSHLDTLVKESKKDFYLTMHSFFPDMELINQYKISKGLSEESNKLPSFDPWYYGKESAGYITQLEDNISPLLLPALVMSKSFSLITGLSGSAIDVSDNYSGYMDMEYITDLCSLFSVDFVMSKDNLHYDKNNDNTVNYLSEINEKMYKISKITKKRTPFSEILFVYPVQTIMNLLPGKRASAVKEIFRIINQLTLNNIQVDIFSPVHLTKSSISEKGIKLGSRVYKSIIFPFAEIVDQKTLQIIQKIKQQNIPVIFLGKIPAFTTDSIKISEANYSFFNTDSDFIREIAPLLPEPVAKFPKNSVGTHILLSDRTIILAAPSEKNLEFSGKIIFEEEEITVKNEKSLVVLEKIAGEKLKRIF